MSAKNVALCKALGWRVVHNPRRQPHEWELYSPSGEFIRDRIGFNPVSEEQAWRWTPDYEHDIALCIATLESIVISDQSVSVQIKIRADETLCGIEKGGQDVVVCYAVTPAEACFAALCAYYHVEVSSE